MCTLRVEALSFPGLLEDPLIRLMMDSDGVSAADLQELMEHVRELGASHREIGTSLQPQPVEQDRRSGRALAQLTDAISCYDASSKCSKNYRLK